MTSQDDLICFKRNDGEHDADAAVPGCELGPTNSGEPGSAFPDGENVCIRRPIDFLHTPTSLLDKCDGGCGSDWDCKVRVYLFHLPDVLASNDSQSSISRFLLLYNLLVGS